MLLLVHLWREAGAEPGYAGPLECRSDSIKYCAAPAGLGDRAPFAGQFLTTGLAIDCFDCFSGCSAFCELETARTASIARAKIRLVKQTLTASIAFHRHRAESLEAEIRPWYESPPVVAIVTAILFVAYSAATGD